MTQKSVYRFVDAIKKFVPIKVTVTDSNTVENVFYTEEELKKDD